jgi:hypothetical protein
VRAFSADVTIEGSALTVLADGSRDSVDRIFDLVGGDGNRHAGIAGAFSPEPVSEAQREVC